MMNIKSIKRNLALIIALGAYLLAVVLVLTRPQVRFGDAEARIAAAKASPLPAGPTAWPEPEPQDEDSLESAEDAESTTRDEEV